MMYPRSISEVTLPHAGVIYDRTTSPIGEQFGIYTKSCVEQGLE